MTISKREIFLFFKRNIYKFFSQDKLITSYYRNFQGRDIDQEAFFENVLVRTKLQGLIPDLHLYTDKYRVRDYVEAKGLAKILIPIYGIYNTVAEASIACKDRASFILKPTHDCGGGYVKFSDDKYDEVLVQDLAKRLNTDYGLLVDEPHYSKINPKLICEQLLITEKNTLPEDYKLFYINGDLEFVYVTSDRMGENKRRVFNSTGDPLNVSFFRDDDKGKTRDKFISNEHVSLDKSILSKLIAVGDVLASDFPFVRVDLYYVKGQVYFGELTFIWGGGNDRIHPSSFSLDIGKKMLKAINEKISF